MGVPTWPAPRPPKNRDEMGQVAPQAPWLMEHGDPPPTVRRHLQSAMRCEYCGRYGGTLGICDGCGAPNKPANVDGERLDVTNRGDARQRFIDGTR